MGPTKFTKETYLYWYEMMLLLRKFEEKTGQLYGMQKIRGFCHLYIGQEALAAGCMTATRQEDPFITAYRDHGLGLAKECHPMNVWRSFLEKQPDALKAKVEACTFSV